MACSAQKVQKYKSIKVQTFVRKLLVLFSKAPRLLNPKTLHGFRTLKLLSSKTFKLIKSNASKL